MFEGLHQLAIAGGAVHQILVGAVGDHGTVDDVQHLIGQCDRRRTRRHGNDGCAGKMRAQVGQHCRLRRRVERRGRVIEEQRRRSGDQGPRQGNALTLAAGQADASLAHDRGGAVRQSSHEAGLRDLERTMHVIVGDRSTERDVVVNATGEQERLLKDERASAGRHRDRAGTRRNQPGQQVQQGRLARTGGADDGYGSAWRNRRRETGDRIAVGRGSQIVSVGDVVDDHRVVRADEQTLPRVRLDRLIQQVANSSPPGHRMGQFREGVADDPQWEDEQREEVDEAGQLADGEVAAAHTVCTTEHESEIRHVRHEIEQGFERTAQPHRGEPRIAQPGSDRRQAPSLALLGAEGLDHDHSVEAFVHRRAQHAQFALRGIEVPVDPALIQHVDHDQYREQQH